MKTIRIAILLLCVSLLFSCAATMQHQGKRIADSDVLFTEKGEEILGTLQKSDGDKIVFKTIEGEVLTLSPSEVQRIAVAPPPGEAKNLDDLNDPELVEWIRTAPTAEQLPGRNYVYLYSGLFVTEKPDGHVQYRMRRVIKILREKGKDIGDWRESYTPDIEKAEIISARSIAPDGTISELAHTAIKEARPYARFPMYDRMAHIVFAVPNAEVDSVIDIVTSIDTKLNDGNYRLPFRLRRTFAQTVPIVRMEVVLDTPTNSQLTATIVGDNRPETAAKLQGDEPGLGTPSTITKTETTNKGRTHARWYASPLILFNNEPYAPYYDEISPSLVISAKASWQEIARNYQQEMAPKLVLDDAAKAYVHGITDGKSKEQAAHDLYSDLVFRINEITFGPGVTYYEPHDVSQMFRQGYANAWDISLLYFAMLREAGIDAQLAATHPWNWYLQPNEPPVLSQMSRLVVAVNVGDRTVYASCGDNTVPFGELYGTYSGAPMLVLSDGSGRIEKLPTIHPDNNTFTRTMRIEVNRKGGAVITENRAWTGPKAFDQRNLWKMPEQLLEKKYEKKVHKIISNARLIDFDIYDRKDLDQPVHETFKYSVDRLEVISANRYMAFTLPGTSYEAAKEQQGARRLPIMFGTPYRAVRRYEIVPGPGVKIAAIPDSIEASCPMGSFTRTVERQPNGTIIVEDTRISNGHEYPASEYENYLAYRKLIQNAGRQEVIFDIKP